MGKVNVVIVDATGNKEQKVGLPDDIKCGIIMVKLVEKIKLPSVGPDGNPISYKFIHKVTGRQLLESQTLGEAGIKDGDVLRLQPEITAGAFCTSCGADLVPGTTFCTKCGAAIQSQEATPVQNEAPIQNASPVQGAEAVPQQNMGVYPNMQQPNYMQKNNFAGMGDKLKEVNKKNIFEIIFYVIGMISGVISIIGASVVNARGTGAYEAATSYGGDAYTGIQNAAAQTANNVQSLAFLVQTGMSRLLIVLGIALICYFGAKLVTTLQKKVA